MSERLDLIKKNMMHPYNLAIMLDSFFKEKGCASFGYSELIDIVETLQATGSVKNQERTFNFFKTLPREELLKRSRTVSKLYKLLINIKCRKYDIQMPQTEQT